MSSFIFWQRWLLYSSLIFALWGVVLAVDGYNSLFSIYNKALFYSLWQKPQFPPVAEPFHRFILGPLGGTIACCYLLLAYIAAHPFKNKERWARNAIISGFSLWFIVDSSIALINGVYFHIYIVNIFSILVKALPLFFTWKEFKIKKNILN